MMKIFKSDKEKKEDKLREMTYDNLQDFSFNGKEMLAKILDVYDGDTIITTIKVEDIYYKIHCRLSGIDTPELKTEDEDERVAAKEARNHLIELLTGQKMRHDVSRKEIQVMCANVNSVVNVRCFNNDKYGRVLVEIIKEGININKKMVEDGYAGVYDGKKKIKWSSYYNIKN